MRYRFVQEFEGQFGVAGLCRMMAVSRSGYYAWRKRPLSARANENARLTEQIKAVFAENRQTYGSPRLFRELVENGVACSEKRVARLMRLNNLRATLPKRFVATTDSRHSLPVAPNLLSQKFAAQTPDTRWASDISYIWTSEGWLYLAVVLDLFSRRVVGWAMGETLERSLVIAALRMAHKARRPAAGLLCHSDRGSQYASSEYQKALEDAGIVCSMSRKGNCYDNAPVESFFASLKRELVHRVRFATREEARRALFEWVEVWYNRKRRHSSLGYVSPVEFERRQQQQQLGAMAA